MINKSELILVAGVTGQQGGTVARQLLHKGYHVRGLTRHPDKAQDLQKLGAEIVTGDLTNSGSLRTALHDVRHVFLVTTPFEAGEETETRQGITMVDAARDAGVLHLVFSSVGSAHLNTAIPHFKSKWQVEMHIRQIGLPATIIRPVFFYENFGSPWLLPSLQSGKLRMPMKADCGLQMIAVENVGQFAVAALENPDRYIGKEIDIAGDELTIPHAVRMISEASGRSITYEQMPESEAEAAVGHDFAVMYHWFNEVGYSVNIPGLEKEWGIRTTRFKQWLNKSQVVRELRTRKAA